MFQASSCPSSGAYQLQQQPLVYRRNVMVAVLLVMVGHTHTETSSENCTRQQQQSGLIKHNWTDHDQQHCCHHVPTVNQRLLLQLIDS